MSAADLNQLFARAEKAFIAGRADAARADLAQVRRLAGPHPAVLHLSALVEKKAGDLDEAARFFEQALKVAPGDGAIIGNYANLLDARGDSDAALIHYDRALAVAPKLADVRYNRALLLQKLGRPEDALVDLDILAAAGTPAARVQSARGGVLRALGRLDEAALAYDAALAAEPKRLIPLHGRARIALERGEADAATRYRDALSIDPGNEDVRLGLAEALEAAGDPQALTVLAKAVAANLGWTEGQTVLARMRWEAGEGRAYTRDLERALSFASASRDLWVAYVSALAAADLFEEAADVAAAARSATGDDASFLLLEATYASEAGQIERADALFGVLPADWPSRPLNEARHRLRAGDYETAARLLDRARDEDPWSVHGWALTGLAWRLSGDPRADWLNEQEELFGSVDLDIDATQIAVIADCLRRLHRTRAHPIGQSLRGGTQTRGRLFERAEPEIRRLRQVIGEAVAAFWNRLPALDEAHPLLRHRDREPRVEGSWSVRLREGGFHVAHCHPQGILSSAAYFVVPAPRLPCEGWLEIGGPPHELDLPLKPLISVEPRPGRMALFPSYMYHGTRPFSEGERLTCAFDVIV